MTRSPIWIASALAPALVFISSSTWAQMDNPDFSRIAPTRISPHVYMLAGFPNVAIIVGTRAALVVDTGLGRKRGAQVAAAAAKLAPGKKLYLTTTHYHPEHAAGDAGFPRDTVLIHAKVQQEELDRDGKNIIQQFLAKPVYAPFLGDVAYRKPDTLFDRDYNLDLGGVKARLLWRGPAHTAGDEEVLIEGDSVLITGDVVQNKRGPGFSVPEANPRKWLETVRSLAPLKPRIVLPDHSPPGDGAILIAQEEALLAELDKSAKALKRKGVPVAEAGQQVTAAMKAKYPDWNFPNLSDAVARSYADRG